MAKKGYSKVYADDAHPEKASLVSFLYFLWMSNVFKKGSERALEKTDFLPLSEENTSFFVIEQLKKNWTKEKTMCKENGKKPRLWKSVLKILSVKDVMFLFSTGTMITLCHIFQPLLLGYLIVSLTSAEPQPKYLLYGCGLAMGINEVIGTLSMHHFAYRGELLGIRMSSALKGLVYLKVSLRSHVAVILQQSYCSKESGTVYLATKKSS